MAAAIEQAVGPRLLLRSDPKSYGDYDSLAADYSASVELLRTATCDMRRLSAELDGLLVQVAAMQLRERLDRMLDRFAKGVATVFAQLQSAELIGRVDWKVATACDAFYFEDVVLHEHLGEEVITAPAEDVQFDDQRMVRRVRQEVRTVSKDRDVVRHGLHLKVAGAALLRRAMRGLGPKK